MRHATTILAALLALAVPAPAALAQGEPVDPKATVPAPPPPPEPKPKAGKSSIGVAGGIPTRRLRYVARGDRVAVEGRVRPAVRGEIVVLEVRRRGKLVAHPRRKVRRNGKLSWNVKLRAKGIHKLRVRHRASGAQRAFRSRAVRVKAVSLRNGEGASGIGVLLLQRGLKRLGFAVPTHGRYDDATARAVIAFRKTNGMERIGYASRAVYAKVLRGNGAFKPKYPGAGDHVEYDWSRQVLAFVRNGRTFKAYHSSSGTPATPTVFGTFTFYRKQPGTNSLGMVHSNYFIRGYAIHGYHSVPTYPASHGCLRVPIPNALEVDGMIEIGMRIMVYV